MSKIKTPILDLLNNQGDEKVIQLLMEGINSFVFSFNGLVEVLVKMTERDAPFREKHEVVECLIQMMTKHLKQDTMEKQERDECMMVLAFYETLKAIYEKGMNSMLVTQEYINSLEEVFIKRKEALGVPVNKFDFLTVGMSWDSAMEKIKELENKGDK